MTTFTPRQLREREYYDQFAKTVIDMENPFSAIGEEVRPWNSYWRQFQLVKSYFRPGHRLLDFGCGWGDNTVAFAKIGYDVHGFDISPRNIELANRLAAKYGLQDRVHLECGVAEELAYPDSTFDMVAGVDILHHVDVEAAIRECHRVLKRGGVAIFREPVESSVFDAMRNSWVSRRLYPSEASFARHVTEDERKLTRGDLKKIEFVFPNTEIEYSRIISRLAAIKASWLSKLEKIDYALRDLPGMAMLGGYAVLILHKD